MHTSASSVMFLPHNFHDRDVSRESAQGVKLKLHADGSEVEYFGAMYKGAVTVAKEVVEPDLSGIRAPGKSLMSLQWNETVAAL